MADLTGRCKNVEYCANAASQRLIAVPDTEPFLCPKCGEKLEESRLKRWSAKRQIMIGVQAVVLVAGAGGVIYKLTGGVSAPATGAAPAMMAPASPVEAAADPVPVPAAAAPAAAPVPQETAAPVPLPQTGAQPTILLHMAGADVVATKLARRLASGYLALIGDSDISLAKGSSDDTVLLLANQAGEKEAISIAGNSSAGGFNALLRGTADIALSARPATAAEVENLASIGDLTSPASEHVIAVEGIAAIVSPANRIASLSMAQLRGVFTGQVHDWSQLGAAPGPIHVFVQRDAAGAHDRAADLVLAGSPPAADATLLDDETSIAGRVATDRNAIGLVALSNAGNARALSVGEGDAAPVAPTELAVSTEDYPLTRRLFFYTGATQSNVVRRFTDYVASANGQAAVEAAGFVPLTIKAQANAVPDTASTKFRAIIGGATRLSVDFRFQPGSIALDSRGVRDLERLVAYLRAQHVSADRLILAGFADSHGTPDVNLAVSQRRTDAVAAALAKSGITPGKALSFGADLPVADNATPDGRERNRRVEVYLATS
jgi:phosphate transport system substrate-binding protein